MMLSACNPASVADCSSRLALFGQDRASSHQVSGASFAKMRFCVYVNFCLRRSLLDLQRAISVQKFACRFAELIEIAVIFG